MAREDVFKRWQSAGASFVGTAKERAEGLLRQAGSSSEGAAESLVDTIRREITHQLSHLGLATKADLEVLERRLADHDHATSPAPSKRLSGSSAGAGSTSSKPPSTKAARSAAAPASGRTRVRRAPAAGSTGGGDTPQAPAES